MDPTTIGTVLGSAVAVVAAAIFAIRKRNGKTRDLDIPPPRPALASSGEHGLSYDALADTRNPMDRVVAAFGAFDRKLDEVQAAIDDGRWCTKDDLGAVSRRLEGVESATTDHTRAIGALAERVSRIEGKLDK